MRSRCWFFVNIFFINSTCLLLSLGVEPEKNFRRGKLYFILMGGDVAGHDITVCRRTRQIIIMSFIFLKNSIFFEFEITLLKIYNI